MRYEHLVLQGENCVSREERREKNIETGSLSEERKFQPSFGLLYIDSGICGNKLRKVTSENKRDLAT
jgi:hypothetical protein